MRPSVLLIASLPTPTVFHRSAIVRAAATLTNYQDLLVVFLGDGEVKSRLMELADELHLPTVSFIPSQPKRRVPAFIAASDVCLLPVRRDDFFQMALPNKLFDYMAAGKPVIFSVKASNNPVEEAHCGFTVQARDPQALAEAVTNLYQMPIEEREALGHRGRKYVELHHAIPVLAERMIQCFEGTLR